jgi:hypothetical protein
MQTPYRVKVAFYVHVKKVLGRKPS